MCKKPSDAIELLGGARAVSEVVGRPYTTVASWAKRQSIPPSLWSRLVLVASANGVTQVTYEALAKAHERKARISPQRQRHTKAA